MLTNVIAYLHTTLAYQSAAMQLMVGQVNFDAQQLHLKEVLPITVPADPDAWNVAPPPDGIAGGFASSNYVFRFTGGKLVSIVRKSGWRNLPGADQPSLIDTNGAYQLATQWLAAISVDVPALERQHPLHVIQLGSRPINLRNHVRPGPTNGVGHEPGRGVRPPPPERRPAVRPVNSRPMAMLPLFRVTWGDARPEITMDILGSTKECLNLRIQDPGVIKSAPLRVANADALLGPPPPPQHFVEEFLGGKTAYDTVAHPDRVVAWLLGPPPDDPGSLTNRTPAVSVDVNTAAMISRALTDFNSYSWLEEQGCGPEYDVRWQFTRGRDNVEILWNYNCDHVQVAHNGQSAEKDCGTARVALAQAVKTIFPRDEAVRNLSLLNPNPSN